MLLNAHLKTFVNRAEYLEVFKDILDQIEKSGKNLLGWERTLVDSDGTFDFSKTMHIKVGEDIGHKILVRIYAVQMMNQVFLSWSGGNVERTYSNLELDWLIGLIESIAGEKLPIIDPEILLCH